MKTLKKIFMWVTIIIITYIAVNLINAYLILSTNKELKVDNKIKYYINKSINL